MLSLTEAGRLQLKGIHSTWQEMDEFINKTIGRDKALMLAELMQELSLALGGRVPGQGSL